MLYISFRESMGEGLECNLFVILVENIEISPKM
jgi:hypothetical protein